MHRLTTQDVRQHLEHLTSIFIKKAPLFFTGAFIAKGSILWKLDDIEKEGRAGDAPIHSLRGEVHEEITDTDAALFDHPSHGYADILRAERWLYSEVLKYLTPNQEPIDLPQS